MDVRRAHFAQQQPYPNLDPALVNDGGTMRFDIGFLVAHALLHGNAGSVRAERSGGQALYVIDLMIETAD